MHSAHSLTGDTEPSGGSQDRNQSVDWTGKVSGHMRLEVMCLYYSENVFGFHQEWIGGNGIIESDSRKNVTE